VAGFNERYPARGPSFQKLIQYLAVFTRQKGKLSALTRTTNEACPPTPAGTVTQLLTFNMSNGANPHAALIQCPNGVLYGTTEQGGTNGNNGTVFQITTNGQFTILVSFNNTNGADPVSALLQGTNAMLYGTTQSGGTNGGYGTVFQITTNGQLTTLVSFNNTNGANPLGALVRTADGTLFGTTYSGVGGTTNGTVFQISTNGQLTTLVSFNGANGANPYSGLIRASDGNFYGTTYNGGSAGVGTVFKMTLGGALTSLASFNNTNGAHPFMVLTHGSDGDFYGTTEFGGTNGGFFGSGDGTIFKVTTNGALNSLVSFSGKVRNAWSGSVTAPGSFAAAFGDEALWITSTQKNLVTRVDPHTNLVVETIPVGPAPRFLATGEGSVWTLNQGDGTVSRIDPKTNKVVATIEVGVPGEGGDIAVGEGSVWVTSFEFPLSRIDPATNKVVQQFAGPGGDAIRVGQGSVWLTDLKGQQLWRIDPRRIEATLAE